MQHHATLVQAGQPPLAGKATSSGLPRDLLEQVRGRLGLLALLMLFAFAIDPFFYFGTWAVVTLGGGTVAADYFRNAAYYWSDLAVVAGDDLELPALKLRTEIPAQGERAWSIGFPLNLGLTITEGVANGLVENSIEQRIHYTGAINGGMSGGPALDRRGRVYGVNVSVVTGRQLVGFVVPAKHIPALLTRAKSPLDQAACCRLVAADR